MTSRVTRLGAAQRIAVGVLLLGLSACGSGDDQTADLPSTASATAVTDSPASSAAATGSGAGVSEELCQFLEQEVPGLKARGSGAAALADFTISYSNWIEKDPDRKFDDAQELDTVTTASCPQVREDILAVLEAPSFAAAFGG